MLNTNQSRRKLFQSGLTSALTLSALALPIKLLAAETQPAPQPPVCPPVKVKVIVSEVSSNHGHEFTITLNDLIKGGKANYSIKGGASHAHGVQITNDVIVDLMQGKKVTLASSTDSSHSHNVVMQLVEK